MSTKETPQKVKEVADLKLSKAELRAAAKAKGHRITGLTVPQLQELLGIGAHCQPVEDHKEEHREEVVTPPARQMTVSPDSDHDHKDDEPLVDEKPKRKENAWNAHCKQYAKDKGVSYSVALKEAKASYWEHKGK